MNDFAISLIFYVLVLAQMNQSEKLKVFQKLSFIDLALAFKILGYV